MCESRKPTTTPLASNGVPVLDAPFAGVEWMRGNKYTPSTLSTGIVTDLEWTALRASTFMVKGTCDLPTVQEALKGESVVPVTTIVDGHGECAVATIWFNELHDSVCGAYHEIVVSFDVALDDSGSPPPKLPGEAAPTSCCTGGSFSLWYNMFNNCCGCCTRETACQAQYLHTLYINSPLSIMWGRESQAFPKHPQPVQSTLDLTSDALHCELKWPKDTEIGAPLGQPLDESLKYTETIIKISTQRNFGCCGFLREAIALLFAVGRLH